ncbi:MAG: exodeoxyribonuclease V subunit beta [Desulfobacterales bacterium]|jgi:exodeoxyribonuclease V beta subunit
MQPFDLLHTPLEGICLIEASAGTGKTYNIEGLFIRLILELQLQVDQILVLTFTNAATEELKDRIRNKLVQTKDAFMIGASDDPLIKILVDKNLDPVASTQRIHDAVIDFDKAAIFTIHGFCQRILYEHAFETRHLFDTELVTDQSSLIREVVDDFWRKTFYPAPNEFISFTLSRISGPDYFSQLLNKVKTSNVNIVPNVGIPSLNTLGPFRKSLDILKAAWPSAKEAVIHELSDPALNATLYGSLKRDVNRPEITKRDLKVSALVDAMNLFAKPMRIGFPLFDEFEKFTTAKLVRATKKNHTPPSNDFFDLCEDVFTLGQTLKTEMEQYLLFLKTQLFAFADSELLRRKKQKNIQYFDDLLITVKDALYAEEGNLLAQAIRQKYRAALVDEFQDTDNIQYEILSRLFSHKNSLLFMIGDPKQAIYSFRGADIFSYMQAARQAESKFTLTENWRSKPKLIAAVNTIFSSTKSPFVFEEIPFEKGHSPSALQTHEKGNRAPFIIWYLDSRKYSENSTPVNKTDAVRLIADAVADEISRLLTKTNPVQPGDIAILVRTNKQAQLIKHILTSRNVPSVLYSTANIFDCAETVEVGKILTAIADPTNTSRLKAAFTTEILGIQADDLISDDLQSQWWETRLARIRKYHQLWNQYNFMRMFRLLVAEERIKQRLLSFPDGERRLTNVMHLSEILHQQSTERNLGITGLLKWLAEQRDPSTLKLDEHQLRLESDEKAVKIVTIHKSKGLEYPVVFCPFGWESSLVKNREFTFHDIENKRQLTFDLSLDSNPKHIALAQNELLSENLRLLYVALTRAKDRCYLAWGRIRTAETSALSYLLHNGADQAISSPFDDRTRRLKQQFATKTDADLLEQLQRLASRSQDSIQIESLPGSSDAVSADKKELEEQLFCRRFDGEIDRSWKISSFSSLAVTESQDMDLPDRDALLETGDPTLVDSSQKVDTTDSDDVNNIFLFPKGTRAGSFFHDIFEHLDYTQTDPGNLETLVAGRLQIYGLDTKWQATVCRAIRRILSIPLHSQHTKLKLSSIPMSARINEMEFYFPLQPVSVQRLQNIFKDYGRDEMSEDFPAQLGKLAFEPSQGFMKGYIDLVFNSQGRFYLVDWKSNHLGSTPDRYDQASLSKTMQENVYILQYHIYTLAVHTYLRLQKPNYRYERDFGGVFYIFIRGVDERWNPEYGIFYDLPHPALIHELGNALISDYQPDV